MKRVLLGTKRKRAIKALKPVAKRPASRKKSKPAKIAAKKTTPARKITKAPAKVKTAKAKAVRKRKASPAKATTAKKIIAPKARRKPTRKSSIQKKISAATPAATTQATKRAARKTVRRRPSASVKETAPPAEHSAASSVTPIPAKRPVAKRKAPRPPKLNVPAFLLEGDEPSHPDVSGPGEKFSLGPTPALEHFSEAIAPLPDSYGTGKLFLTARDPHWLYANWDFTREQQFRHNARSVDRHLVLRVHHAGPVSPSTKPVAEYHVHPESKHWFVHVERAGALYTTELGYYQAGRKWQSLAFSAPQRTPPDNISADSTVKLATIPAELSFETMLALLKETAGEFAAQNTPLAHIVDKIRPRAREHFPKTDTPGEWTAEQEQALADILAADRAMAARPSSEEFVAEQPWPEFAFDFETGEAAPLTAPTSYVSSFFGGEVPKDFWFHVNAELIVYGATEPNATVTFAGKQIQLRPDGSFRFRFALPDGYYELPVTAVSADRTDGRAAELKFSRTTEIRGHVASAPADPALKPPPVS